MNELIITLTKVPTTIEEDVNKGVSRWKDGKFTELSEGCKYTNIYINHVDILEDNIDGVTKAITKAYQLKIEKPVNQNKVIIAAEKKAYGLNTDKDYCNFKIQLSNLSVNNSNDPRIVEYNKFIWWIKDGYCLYKGATLEEAKSMMIRRIKEYDTSEEVNVFFLNESPAWLDKDTRVGLMNSITIEKSVGLINTTLWLGTQSYTLPIDLAIGFLAQLEIYAKECYNKTAEHLANIEKLTLSEEVLEYNYKEGYPEKLRINI